MCQTYAGAAIHADDLRTTAASKDAVSLQASVISNFGRNACLKLNASKLEVRQCKDPEELNIAGVKMSTWQYNLSASRALHENIGKARKVLTETSVSFMKPQSSLWTEHL